MLVGYSQRLNCFRVGRSRSIRLAINSPLKSIAINVSFLSIPGVGFGTIDFYQSSFYYTFSLLRSRFNLRLNCNNI